MKEKFNFTNWKEATWGASGEVDTSLYGERTTKNGDEELFIRITLKDSIPSFVVFRHYLGGKLLVEEIRYYTDTMELVQGIRKYINEKEK